MLLQVVLLPASSCMIAVFQADWGTLLWGSRMLVSVPERADARNCFSDSSNDFFWSY